MTVVLITQSKFYTVYISLILEGRGIDKKKKRLSSGSEKRELFIKMIIGFVLLIAYFISINIYYSAYLSQLVDYCNFYNSTAQEESNYLLAYNILREYLNNNNSTIFEKPVKQAISETIENYYSFMSQSQTVK
jgi:hypothetical protein